jgi:putative Mn2+ efflux pump MntP
MNDIILEYILTGTALAMDALAVSVSCGVADKRMRILRALLIAAAFGLFQAFMPVVGWFAATLLQGFGGDYNKWIAFAFLLFVGGKMFWEGLKEENEGTGLNSLTLKTLVVLALATSMDALAVGVSYSCLNRGIWMAAGLIGIVTFAISFAGVQAGRMIGHFFENRLECLGGLVIIAIGVKILLN